MTEVVNLRRFDVSRMQDSCVVAVVARRNSGKSVLIRDIMYHKRHISAGIVCSGTEDGNGYYSKFVPDLFVYPDFDRDAVENMVERQRALAKQGLAEPVFLVLDDCLYDKKFLNDKLLKMIFFNGRHWSIFVILAAQYLVDIPPNLRSNIDYIFTLSDHTNRYRLWKTIFQIFRTFDQFNAVMDAATSDYGALVLDTTGNKSNAVADSVFYYKAQLNLKFRMGSPAFWGYARQKFDPKYDERVYSNSQAPGGGGKKAKGQVVRLKKSR